MYFELRWWKNGSFYFYTTQKMPFWHKYKDSVITGTKTFIKYFVWKYSIFLCFTYNMSVRSVSFPSMGTFLRIFYACQVSV